MKGTRFILAGIVFGIVMIKSEAVSWYRIQEMFRFQSFHMYGIIGTAVVLGALSVYIIKKFHLRDVQGEFIHLPDKERQWTKYAFGGLIFGSGWALTGCLPRPYVRKCWLRLCGNGHCGRRSLTWHLLIWLSKT